jgi:hypothetical protein
MDVSRIDRFLTPYDSRDLLKRHIYARCEAALDGGDAARDRISTKEELIKRQEYIRSRFLSSIGFDLGYPVPVSVETAGTVNYAGYRVEKQLICPEKDVYITTNLYLPAGLTGKTGAVLFLCGHAAEGKLYPEYLKVCRYLVSAGLVVLAIDPTGQGERLNFYDRNKKEALVPPCTADHDHAGLRGLLIGRNIAYYFLRDAMCAMSYLASRPEVDPEKLGVTGNSGGGTQTSMMMMADRRVAAAAPGTFIMNAREMLRSGQAQDAEQIWNNMFSDGLDHEDILLSVAPKPLLVLAAEYDFFPKEGTDETVLRARRLWDICGQGDKLEYFTDACFHMYSDAMAEKAADFFSRSFLGKPFSGKLLEKPAADKQFCTKSGQVLADFENAKNILEENREAAKKLIHTDKNNDWLRERVFAHRDIPKNTNMRPVREAYDLGDATAQLYMWRSQKDLYGYGLLIAPKGKKPEPELAIWDGGTRALKTHEAWIEEKIKKGESVFVADLSGMGQLEPYPIFPGADLYRRYGTMYTLCTDLFRVDDSLAALRTFDVIRTLDALNDLFPENNGFSLYAGGYASLYCALAAKLDGRISKLTRENVERCADIFNTDLIDETDILSRVLPGMLLHTEVD